MSREIRIGLIGFGWMGPAHSRSYRNIPVYFPEADIRPRLVVVADTLPERVELALTTSDTREAPASGGR